MGKGELLVSWRRTQTPLKSCTRKNRLRTRIEESTVMPSAKARAPHQAAAPHRQEIPDLRSGARRTTGPNSLKQSWNNKDTGTRKSSPPTFETRSTTIKIQALLLQPVIETRAPPAHTESHHLKILLLTWKQNAVTPPKRKISTSYISEKIKLQHQTTRHKEENKATTKRMGSPPAPAKSTSHRRDPDQRTKVLAALGELERKIRVFFCFYWRLDH